MPLQVAGEEVIDAPAVGIGTLAGVLLHHHEAHGLSGTAVPEGEEDACLVACEDADGVDGESDAVPVLCLDPMVVIHRGRCLVQLNPDASGSIAVVAEAAGEEEVVELMFGVAVTVLVVPSAHLVVDVRCGSAHLQTYCFALL